ncbi:MAG: hypothetical protein Q7T55_24825 [Solirubrobacteraceae bacterium]|nr:hypothetical protein [Solirubrobacteraceae bacterium]
MTPLALRDLRDRSRLFRALLTALVVSMAAATLAHHRGAQDGHDDMGAMGDGHAAAMVTCLGVLGRAVAVVGLVLIRRVRRRTPRPRPRRPLALQPPPSVTPAVWVPPPRDGPALRLHLCVDRR